MITVLLSISCVLVTSLLVALIVGAMISDRRDPWGSDR